jgi:hypothetical protein
MTCRGSRFNPTITSVGQNSDEWSKQNIRSARNFIRKWGSYVKHDPYMLPEIPPKYEMAFVLSNADFVGLQSLEPWATITYVVDNPTLVQEYIQKEQSETLYDLRQRVKEMGSEPIHLPIVVYIDFNQLTQEDGEYLQLLPEVIKDNQLLTVDDELLGLGHFRMKITEINDVSNKLIPVNAEHHKFVK